MNQAPHQLDLWQWICGIPTKVTSKNINGSHRKIDVENDVTIVTEYANGATGSFITTMPSAPTGWRSTWTAARSLLRTARKPRSTA